MNEWVLTRAAVLGGLVLVACGPKSEEDDETSSSDLAGLAVNNVEQALRGTHRAGSFVADSATLANSLGAMAGSSESCSQAPCDANGCPPAECVTVDEPVTVADLQQSRADANESIDSLVKTLREKVFTKENLESEGDGSATYLLGAKTLCTPDGDSASPGTSQPSSSGGSGGTSSEPARPQQLDPDCVKQAERYQIRLRLSSAGGGDVNVALLLTSSKQNPATLELYKNHVGVVVDLGAIKATLDTLGEDTGSLTSLVGKLGFELKRNAELDYSFLANVLEDVKVGVENDAGENVHYGVGHSVPTFELRLDGNARQVTGSLDVGPITVDGPLNAFRDVFASEEYDELGNPIPGPVYTGAVAGLLAGIEGGVTLDGTTDKLTLNHLGLGDQTSTLKVDQNTIVALDVNPQANRHFDITAEKQTAGTLVSFAPTLDAQLLLKLAPLAPQITDLSAALFDNTLHLWFDGQKPSILTGNDQLKVVSGTLNFTESYDSSANISASAGSCVESGDSSDSSAAGLIVTTCQ